MKKYLILFTLILLGALVGGIWYFNADSPETRVAKKVICLKNGERIVADEISEGGALTYYKQGKNVLFVSKKNIDHIEKQPLEDGAGKKIIRMTRDNIKKINNIIPDYHHLTRWGGDLARDLSAHIPKNALRLGGAIVGLTFFFIIVISVSKKLRKTKPVSQEKAAPAGQTQSIEQEYAYSEGRGIQSVVRFFLRIYKQQLGVSDTASDRIVAVEPDLKQSMSIYELRVKKGEKWESRRITVGPLGEGSGSKSKCFYVIYDSYIVVKIPPAKITDFNIYLGSIKKEKRIVTKLAPRICITPKVSVILEKIHSLSGISQVTPEQSEERYVQWLARNSSYQNYLKIDGGFVYFMDLSQYFFLSHVLERYQDLGEKISREIIENADIIWNPQGFEGRYGQDKDQICLNIKNVFNTFEKDVKQLLEKSGVSNIHEYKIREWFMLNLAGKEVKILEKHISVGVGSEICDLLKKIEKTHRTAVVAYREMITGHVSRLSFIQTKAQLSGIITNLLDLLAWLTNKGIAIRDLKPDNLFVAGDSDNYPEFLTACDQYQIGLIDVETAVDYNPRSSNEISQPLLGGTPVYATPSHLMENRILNEVFGDLSLMLNLQDWYAVIAMIYKVLTGKTLFENAGTILPSVFHQLQEIESDDREQINQAVADVSRVFWQRALTDFELNKEESKEMLAAVKVVIPADVAKMFMTRSLEVNDTLGKMITQLITSQTVFKGEKNQKQLIKASSDSIKKLRLKWEGKDHLPGKSSADKERLIEVLSHLEKLKVKAGWLGQAFNQLKRNKPSLSAYNLIELMFSIVFSFMFQKQWGDLSIIEQVEESDKGAVNDWYEATILSDPSLSIEATIKEDLQEMI